MHFADEVVLSRRLDAYTKKLVRDSVKIDATNVGDYFFGTAEKQWGIGDFPNVAPPFDTFFLEGRTPKAYYAGDWPAEAPSRWGCLIRSLPSSDTAYIPDARWTLEITLMGSRFCEPRSIIGYVIGVGSEGEILRPDQPVDLLIPQEQMGKGAEVVKALERIGGPFLAWALLTISFMHCKNVHLVPAEERAMKKSAKRRFDRAGVAPITPSLYHTLNIEPMKQILRTEGNSHKTGLKQALHICRGHFKNYRDGAGLFGKYKGMYWWESQVRGQASEGERHKDYNINLPADS